MGGQLHLVGLTADGCRIARDGGGGYVVNHADQEGKWQRVANLPAAYAACELLPSATPWFSPAAVCGPDLSPNYQLTPCNFGKGAVLKVVAKRRGIRRLLYTRNSRTTLAPWSRTA